MLGGLLKCEFATCISERRNGLPILSTAGYLEAQKRERETERKKKKHGK
jgi:hypothetical protein